MNDKMIQTAIEVGQEQAKRIQVMRNEVKAIRATVLQRHYRKMSFGITIESLKAAQSKTGELPTAVGILVAEGDSWFDYPFCDILKVLEDYHGYEVESVAHKGDPIEQMAYADGQLEAFSRRIEKLLRNNATPKAILLSGGGNDIAGNEFGILLNHANSKMSNLNDKIVAGVIDERIQNAYITILSAVSTICQQQLNRSIPILMHGYDYPVPDGRGFMGGWGPLPGPWLEPGFREKGFDDPLKCKEICHILIDRFNDMLGRLVELTEFAHVRYVDLRNTLSSSEENYKDWWANELHPTHEGFKLVTNKFLVELEKIS